MVPITDRIISIFCYFSFGMFGLFWLIFCAITKKPISSYVNFNIYQSIFISILLAAISLVYEAAITLVKQIPIIGMVFNSIDIFFVRLPLFYTCTLVGLVVGLFALIMSLICLIGKRPIIPVISDIIKSNFGD